MSALFSPKHNLYARLTLLAVVIAVPGLLGLLDVYHRSPYVRYTKVPRTQPVPFSHKHHANMGIDCRYCHATVEDSPTGSVPPTKTCMNCHNILWNEAPMLEPVRKSMAENKSLEWVRVHDLPDFAYFNHSIHVNKGIGCSTCHGRIDEMPLVWKDKPFFMQWCLECHRDPSQFVRPKDKIFDMAFDPTSQSQEVRDQLVKEYGIDHKDLRMTNCSICHR